MVAVTNAGKECWGQDVLACVGVARQRSGHAVGGKGVCCGARERRAPGSAAGQSDAEAHTYVARLLPCASHTPQAWATGWASRTMWVAASRRPSASGTTSRPTSTTARCRCRCRRRRWRRWGPRCGGGEGGSRAGKHVRGTGGCGCWRWRCVGREAWARDGGWRW